jgi:succinoglycan biosynthesis protein ExoM
MTPRVSIVIPTIRRVAGALAARSALAQECDAQFEIVLVDNDPAGGALEQLHHFADRANRHVVIVHEPRPGVANARNAGVRASRGRFIAFLDDDEVAPDRWLAELLRVQSETKADVVFGPVSPRFAEPPRRHVDFFHDVFSRDPHHAEGLIKVFYGCGCSLIRRTALPSAEPFHAECNETGGEDAQLFHAMKGKGAKFAWAPSAYVWETPEPSRVTLAYTLKRAFALGQRPARTAWADKRKRFTTIPASMISGAFQSIVYAAASSGCFMARSKSRAYAYRSFAAGLGKLLWFPGIKLRFYGAAILPKAERRELALSV